MNHQEFWKSFQQKSTPRFHMIFLCAGNICRSPYGEMKCEQLVRKSQKLNPAHFLIQSGGFIRQQEIAIHEWTKQSLIEEGVDIQRIEKFHSRTMRHHKEDLANANILIIFSEDNKTLIPAKYHNKVIMLSEMAIENHNEDIKDPVLLKEYSQYKDRMNRIKYYLEIILAKMESFF